MVDERSWNDEDAWWSEHFGSRPYAVGRGYEEFRPAFRYGFESGRGDREREWKEVEADLRSGWDRFEGKGPGGARWEDIKDAVKDAWHRVTGKHDVDTAKMAAFEEERLSGGLGRSSRRK